MSKLKITFKQARKPQSYASSKFCPLTDWLIGVMCKATYTAKTDKYEMCSMPMGPYDTGYSDTERSNGLRVHFDQDWVIWQCFARIVNDVLCWTSEECNPEEDDWFDEAFFWLTCWLLQNPGQIKSQLETSAMSELSVAVRLALQASNVALRTLFNLVFPIILRTSHK